jgi:hypothetical protein
MPSSFQAMLRFSVSVSAIPAGFIYLPDKEVFEDSLDKDTGRKVPYLSFLVEHGEHTKILFDLGTRKNRTQIK